MEIKEKEKKDANLFVFDSATKVAAIQGFAARGLAVLDTLFIRTKAVHDRVVW